MRFYLAYEKVSEQFEELKLLFRKYMDGDVSAKMKSNGIDYSVNYGVSLVHLRRFAQQYEPSSRLAWRLWESGIREGMLVALMLFEPNLSNEELDELLVKVNNVELAEQFGFSFGYKLYNSLPVFINTLNSENEYAVSAVILSVSNGIIRKSILDDQFLATFLAKIETMSFFSFTMQKSIVRLFSALLQLPSFKERVSALANQWIEDNDKARKAVANEVLIELKYSVN